MKSLRALLLSCAVEMFLGYHVGLCQQDTCGTTYNPADGVIISQEGGIYITADGTFRVLVVFVSFLDDNNVHPYWDAHQPPDDMQSFIDPNGSTNSTNQANLTHYFAKMSFDNYTFIGEAVYVETPQTQAWYSANGWNRGQITTDVLQNAVNPIVNFANYDNWRRDGNYVHSNVPNGVVDMIVMVWRGFQFNLLGQASLGGGNSFPVDGVTIQMGYPTGSGVFCSYRYTDAPTKLLQTMVHEVGHWLLGSGHPYATSDGRYAPWSILGLQYAAGTCANAYERERLAWIDIPEVQFNQNVTISDYVTTGDAYKYHPPNGATYEYYYFENHQKLDLYDDASTNDNDKGVWVIHQLDLYNSSNNFRIKPSDGFWNWENPSTSAACFSQTLPLFRKLSINRTSGYSNRDILPITAGYAWLHVFEDIHNGNLLECGAFFKGDSPFFGSFNTTNNNLFSPWSNPTTNTWSGLSTNIALEAKTQSGSVTTVRFYDAPLSAPPSKPQDLRVSVINVGGENRPLLTWMAALETDVNPSGSILVERCRRIPPQPWTSWTSIATLAGSSVQYIDNSIYSTGSGPDTVQYRIRAKDTQPKYSAYSDARWILFNHNIQKTSFGLDVTPGEYGLHQNYPNPFNPTTSIKYELPVDGNVSLRVYDVLGREAAILVDGFKKAGFHEATLEASNLATGMYFYRLTAGSFTDVKKLIVVK